MIFDKFNEYMYKNNLTYNYLLEKYLSWVRNNNIMLHTDKLEEMSEKVLGRGV